MNKHFKLLFAIFLFANASSESFAQRYKPRREPIDIKPIEPLPPIRKGTPEDLKRVLEQRDPYTERTNLKKREEYCEALWKRNELRKMALFNDATTLTEDISGIKVFISNVPTFIYRDKTKNKNYTEERYTSFYSNYGKPRENVGSISGFLNPENFDLHFNKHFGGNSIDEIKENATFIFEMGSYIGKNTKDIFKKSKNTFLLLPEGLRKCIYNAENKKLYYEEGNHFVEQTSSYEEHLQHKEALNRKMGFDKNLIISFINDIKTDQELKSKLGENYIKIDNQSKFENIEKILIEHKNDRIVLLGHIKDNAFVPNAKNGFDFSLPLSRINSIQDKHNLSLFPLGCKSINSSSKIGFSKDIKSIAAIDAISAAFSTETYHDYFDALSIGDNKCFVSIEIIVSQIKFEATLENYRKIIGEINGEIEKKGEITKAIVYSKLVDSKPNSSEPDATNDEHTLLDFLFLVLKVALVMALLIWLISKI